MTAIERMDKDLADMYALHEKTAVVGLCLGPVAVEKE
jgi:hypothetical protein